MTNIEQRYQKLADRTRQVMAGFQREGQTAKVLTAVVIGVGVTAFTGVAVAAALGTFVLLNERKLCSVFDKRSRRPKPLTPSDWRNAFETGDQRLIGGGEKIIGRVRRGGCDPDVRGDVWPFLLGLYDGNSSEVERCKQKSDRRERFEDLRRRCLELGALAQKEEEKRIERQRAADDEAAKKIAKVAPEVDLGNCDEESVSGCDVKPSVSESEPLLGTPVAGEVGDEEGGVDGMAVHTNRIGSVVLEEAEDCAMASESQLKLVNGGQEYRSPNFPENLPADGSGDAKFLEDLATWRRIMRLDAVRMNAAWIPYSSQNEIPEEEARLLAEAVGLVDDSHLEPSRRHHAARLVAILEVYALQDPEIGYCQGMSDLLSPFVALLTDDAEAFSCFESFMKKARQNFRIDEIGIRQQLETVAKILRLGDPKLYAHLTRMGADDCIFVYRMIVVLMRRELSFEQTLGLWEVTWADAAAASALHAAAAAAASVGGSVVRRKKSSWAGATKDLVLFVVAAAVKQHRKEILCCEAIDEVLRLCNSFVGHLDVWSLLDDARALVAKVGPLV